MDARVLLVGFLLSQPVDKKIDFSALQHLPIDDRKKVTITRDPILKGKASTTTAKRPKSNLRNKSNQQHRTLRK